MQVADASKGQVRLSQRASRVFTDDQAERDAVKAGLLDADPALHTKATAETVVSEG